MLDYVHLYVEKYDKYEGFILLDFVSDEEFHEFSKWKNYPIEERSYTPSGLLIWQVLYGKDLYIREGAVYKVSLEGLLGLQWERNSGSEESPWIGFFLIYNGRDADGAASKLSQLFRQEVSAKPFTYQFTGNWEGKPCGAEALRSDIEVVIRNVGQGNWNEIRSEGKCKVVFDLGCSIRYSKKQCKELLPEDLFQDKPSLIISHWDIDHYNLLTVVSDNDLEKLCCVFVPDECISLTSRYAAERLKNKCTYICTISPEAKRKVKYRISLHVKYNGSQYIVFNGEKCKNKNLSGLAVAVWNKSSCVFLCADHSYYQVFQDMKTAVLDAVNGTAKKSLESASRHVCHMVVPHHGGNAGKVKKTYFFDWPGQAVVSTGSNQYGHPFGSTRKGLCSMGFRWLRTDHLGRDHIIVL